MLAPWRNFCQGLLTLTLLLIPFVRVDGGSLLRIDLPTLSLFLGGRAFAIDELYLLLLAGILLILLFLLVTLVCGRLWCGWGCPQTILTDLGDWFARRLGCKASAGRMAATGGQKLLLHGFSAVLALLVACNLLWYFISPYAFFPALLQGTLPPAGLWFLALVAIPVFLDLVFVRRLLCREICPYGRFQSALVDAGTLTLRFHPDAAPRCIRCGACVRSCPTGIDIRAGYQIECINCGRCLDACRRVMAARRQTGIIRYTFGLDDRGPRALLNSRMLFLALAFLTAGAVLIFAIASRTPATLKVERPAAAPVRILADGRSVNLFSVVAGNRQRQATRLSLVGLDAAGRPLLLLGPIDDILLQPGERRRLDFSVVRPAGAPRTTLRLLLRDASGKSLAEAEARLIPPPAGDPHDQ
ncbi:MAG: 4Fe-4S dicluster domain-containing protein [Desulfuromonadales bacterium]